MLKNCATLSLSLLFSMILLGQASHSLTGKILDNQSRPIAGASIHVLNTETGSISDAEGNFALAGLPPGNYELEITAIGFATQTQQLKLPSGSSLVITLAAASTTLDDVVVSAQKRDEDLQRVPLSVSSLNARQVREYRLWNSNELTAIVPNLYSANSGDDRNVTSIRGITTTSYDPAVATYIDGVNQFGLDTYIANLFDIKRIEVLRGPQGTLYGRNAMGGVINIITREPDNAVHGFVEGNMGNYNRQRWSAGLRAPLIKSKLFAGLAGMYDSRDGYYTNDYNNSSYDAQHSITGNYYVKWIAGRSWDATLNFKHHNTRNKGAFPLVFGVNQALSQPFHLDQNATATMIDNTVNASLVLKHQGSSFNFSSQTAWQSNKRTYDHPLDGDFSPLDGVTIINDYGPHWNRVQVWTQEFRFVSAPASKSRFQWTTGLYLFYQDNPNKQATHFGEDADQLGSPQKNFSLINTTKGKSRGAALYGQIVYPIHEKVQLIGGIRYDFESKSYSVLGEYQPDGSGPITTRPDTSADVHYSALSPKLGLSWQLRPNNHLYVTYSRGFRTGGLTQLSTDPSQPPLYPYKPEYSNMLEAGIKNDWMQHHIRFNLAFFYTHVNDAQVPTLILPDAITVIRNAGKLNSKGVEAELNITALDGLEINYNGGYTDARYQTLKLGQNGSVVDLSGKKQVFTPEFTSQLAAQYQFFLEKKSGLRLLLRGEWSQLGEQYFDLANTIRQGGYSLLNVRAGLILKQWQLMFWGRNVSDTRYIAYAYDFGAVHLGHPRTLGVSLRWQL